MQKHLDSILLRLDTYFVYDDYQKHAQMLMDLSRGLPSPVPFDEIMIQQLDVDSVAELHDTYINKILDSDLIRLRQADLSGVKCEIYINTYFVAFLFSVKDGDISPDIAMNAVKQAYLEQFKLPLIFSYLRLNYSVGTPSLEKMWEICDRTAFPILNEEVCDGRYTDSNQKDAVFIDLTRSIFKEKESPAVVVNVQSKAVNQTSDLREAAESIMNMVEISQMEVSRCFKK